jgi:deoxyadenosine/deoxycytidine kinase
VAFHYLAVEGPIGAGKTTLAERLASRLDATTILEDTENPFLADFYNDRPGAALQAQFVLPPESASPIDGVAAGRSLSPGHGLRLPVRQGQDLRVPEPRRQRAVHLSAALRPAGARHPTPDLVVYLQAPTEVLVSRIGRGADDPEAEIPPVDEDYIRELNEAYQHYFFHYTATPLLVVDTSEFDPETDDAALDELVRQIKGWERARATTSRGGEK